MIKLTHNGVYYYKGKLYQTPQGNSLAEKDYYKGTISYDILAKHNQTQTEKGGQLNIKFDAITSHDITYVGIIQTARAIGLEKFPIPYVLTNCHNSLCAVGGTINEDDHIFGLSAAKKYGAIYVPAHQAVIHSYNREKMAGCGKMILGSDSHTRYGAIGTMAVGEGGPELVKQIIGKTYDIKYPEIIGVHMYGKLRKGVGPQDVSLAIIKAVFKNGFVKNKVMEFFGDGIAGLSMEFRNGIDVMTTETTCLSSIWQTDNITYEYLKTHDRASEYYPLMPKDNAYYDGLIEVNLDKIEPMIALPFHPSNVYTIKELIDNPYEILDKCQKEGRESLGIPTYNLTDKITPNGKILVDQAIIAGCAGGTYDNIYEAANIMQGKNIGNTLSMSVYCGSQPIYLDLVRKGIMEKLITAGVNIKTSFCGPCFGAGDVPANNGLSIRHTTRNFPSREGSKPSDGQIASVALMDARSIAATAANGGYLTSALDYDYDNTVADYRFDNSIYESRVYDGYDKANADTELIYGPNIKDWPDQIALTDNLILKVVTVINDEVTTTDELIPSGETSSYRSNPLKLAEFTLSRKAPYYVTSAKAVQSAEQERQKTGELTAEYKNAISLVDNLSGSVSIASAIFAKKPGDGSAREQAASCQRVLGGGANISLEYATKRYRSNLINWGMIPFIYDNSIPLTEGDIIVIKDVKNSLTEGTSPAFVIRDGERYDITLKVEALTKSEVDIIKAGSLINYNKSQINN